MLTKGQIRDVKINYDMWKLLQIFILLSQMHITFNLLILLQLFHSVSWFIWMPRGPVLFPSYLNCRLYIWGKMLEQNSDSLLMMLL